MSRKTTQHICELSTEEKKVFLDSFDIILCDCDGVLWLFSESIPNTGKPVNLLKAAGKKIKFVSNNSLRTDEEYMKKFKNIGVENVNPDDMVYTTKIMIKVLQQRKPGEKVFSLCSKEANELLKANNIDFSTPPLRDHWTPEYFVTEMEKNDKVGAVLLDYNFDLSYIGLAKANQYLKDPDCLLISGGADSILAISRKVKAIGFIDFINNLSNNSGKEPIFVAKPSNVLGDVLIEMFNIDQPQRCLFIGDSLRNDVSFAKSFGFQALHVLTGVGSKDQMLNAEGNAKPDYYVDGITDFITFFESLKS